MLPLVPIIHAREDFFRLMNSQIRPFGKNVEIAVGDDRGYFDDFVDCGLQTRHLEIDPDQVLGTGHACANHELSGILAEANLAQPHLAHS